MLIYDAKNHKYIIDPHYLNIKPVAAVWESDTKKDKPIATALLMWMYHMYNPHSPYRDYRNLTKSLDIIEATFPKDYITERLKVLEQALTAINETDKPVELKPMVYDPAGEPNMESAIAWYQHHLKQTPLWNAYESYKEAMYNLSKIIRDPNSTAVQIKTASMELDTIPGKMDKMRKQAEKDEAMTIKVSGDKPIRRSEMLEQEIKSKANRERNIID